MWKFLVLLFETSITMSVIALLYMSITPSLSKRFTAKGRYYTWLIIIIGFVIPFRFHPQVSAIQMITSIPNLRITNNYTLDNNKATVFPWYMLVCGLWLAGVFIFVAVHVIRHRCFLKMVKRWSTYIVDEQVLNTLYDVESRLQIKQQVELRVCPNISSPMLIGFIYPTIILPADNVPIDELSLILKHELIHFKRRDIWYKALVFLATAFHWFNPIVYMIAREIAIQCEISCDEEVVIDIGIDGRKKYVEAIIGIIRKQSMVPSKFSTNFYSSKQGIKDRVFSIMDGKCKKWGCSILIITIVATFNTGMMIKISASEPSSKYSVLAYENEPDPKSIDLKIIDTNSIDTNSIDSNSIDDGNIKMYRSLLETNKPFSEKENNISDISTDVVLMEGKEESDTPKLIGFD